MNDDEQDPIKRLAQKAARCNLSIRSALALFDALYAADAIALSKGSVAGAARRAGIQRQSLIRMQKRSASGMSEE